MFDALVIDGAEDTLLGILKVGFYDRLSCEAPVELRLFADQSGQAVQGALDGGGGEEGDEHARVGGHQDHAEQPPDPNQDPARVGHG